MNNYLRDTKSDIQSLYFNITFPARCHLSQTLWMSAPALFSEGAKFHSMPKDQSNLIMASVVFCSLSTTSQCLQRHNPCNIYTFQRDTQCCSTDCLLMHRCQLYMFRTGTVHPQEFLFRCCMCRLRYVVRTALSDTSRWYNVCLSYSYYSAFITEELNLKNTKYPFQYRLFMCGNTCMTWTSSTRYKCWRQILVIPSTVYWIVSILFFYVCFSLSVVSSKVNSCSKWATSFWKWDHLTLCRSNLNPHCLGRKAVFFSVGI